MPVPRRTRGPAGVTIVIIRDDLIAKSPADLPSMVNYKVLAENKSLLNTPPTFAIYIVKLVTDWLLNEIGGLAKMEAINRGKAQLLYDVVDGSNGFYLPHAEMDSRSIMNVPFRLANTGTRRAVPEAGGRARAGRVEGPSQRRRMPRFDLQRHARRRRQAASRLHERVRPRRTPKRNRGRRVNAKLTQVTVVDARRHFFYFRGPV